MSEVPAMSQRIGISIGPKEGLAGGGGWETPSYEDQQLPVELDKVRSTAVRPC